MTYVRTKDGRIGKVISVRDYNGPYPTYYHVSFQNDKEIYNDYELDIIKETYTIEELCDRCLVITRYRKEPIYGTFYELGDYIDEWKRKLPSNDPVVDIYGAIWTDKGLLYVAKMNEKGELELL